MFPCLLPRNLNVCPSSILALPHFSFHSSPLPLCLSCPLIPRVPSLVSPPTPPSHLSQAVLNMGCCFFFLLAKFIHSLVFGALQHSEQQDMRDKFWNFVFYKFIFVFGVMNVQEVPEMLCWCVWFAVLGTLLLSEQLSKDRFQFVS